MEGRVWGGDVVSALGDPETKMEGSGYSGGGYGVCMHGTLPWAVLLMITI